MLKGYEDRIILIIQSNFLSYGNKHLIIYFELFTINSSFF